MDIFCEYIVKHKKTIKDYLIFVLTDIVAFILSIIVLMFYNYTMGFGLLIIAAIWYGAYIIMRNRFVEYEYALTSNELDIDKKKKKKRRKHIMTVDFKNITLCAPADDITFCSEFNNTQAINKTYDFTGTSRYEIYFADFQGIDGNTRILFNPTDKMKESLQLINPRAVHIR